MKIGGCSVLSALLSTLMVSSWHGNVSSFSPISISTSLKAFPNSIDNRVRKTYDYTSSDTTTSLMGIPKMFRWLTDQYPSINRQLNEGLNTNTVVDYFYLDMNGIIHPCTHGNSDTVILLDETEMFKKIFGYVDRLYKLVRPREVLYLAVDGVAPRAKMNQQRSRRFRSAKEAEVLLADYLAQHGTLPESSSRFDSNCITPGTDFMLKLGLALDQWIKFKQETDPFWKEGAKVILSGPDVPGEGEHKVMDYIRELQEDLPADDENPLPTTGKRHVLYGLDADLIMLGLVTHEPEFTLLREKMSVVMAGRGKGRNSKRKKKDMLEYDRNDFELLELNLLTQMFKIQFRKFADEGSPLKSTYDNNRIIDDFVFMCMLVGNDFLPHAPHLEIDNGALTLMLSTYIDLLPEWGGYLTDKEKISMKRFEQFLYTLGFYEQEHFKRRGYEESEPGWGLPVSDDEYYGTYYQDKKKMQKTPEEAKIHSTTIGKDEFDSISNTVGSPPDIDPNDIKSYRDFYYASKLGYDPKTAAAPRRQTVRDYVEGLHWVLHYYHKGCGAWNWYFPHLYAPLVTDMVNLEEFYPDDANEEFQSFAFHMGDPFPSLGQLLSVLPPQSSELLPKPLSELMTNPSSPIADFYPTEFTTDANGKRQSWEAVVKVPFINANSLLDVLNTIVDSDNADENGKSLLTNAERRRNVRGKSHEYVPPEFGEGAKKMEFARANARANRMKRNPRGRRGPGGRKQ